MFNFLFIELYSTGPKLTNAEVRKKRNVLFEEEKKRQRSKFVKRIEKILIEVETPGENVQLMMNKYISTPYNCAMRKYIPIINIVRGLNGNKQ